MTTTRAFRSCNRAGAPLFVLALAGKADVVWLTRLAGLPDVTTADGAALEAAAVPVLVGVCVAALAMSVVAPTTEVAAASVFDAWGVDDAGWSPPPLLKVGYGPVWRFPVRPSGRVYAPETKFPVVPSARWKSPVLRKAMCVGI